MDEGLKKSAEPWRSRRKVLQDAVSAFLAIAGGFSAGLSLSSSMQQEFEKDPGGYVGKRYLEAKGGVLKKNLQLERDTPRRAEKHRGAHLKDRFKGRFDKQNARLDIQETLREQDKELVPEILILWTRWMQKRSAGRSVQGLILRSPGNIMQAYQYAGGNVEALMAGGRVEQKALSLIHSRVQNWASPDRLWILFEPTSENERLIEDAKDKK